MYMVLVLPAIMLAIIVAVLAPVMLPAVVLLAIGYLVYVAVYRSRHHAGSDALR